MPDHPSARRPLPAPPERAEQRYTVLGELARGGLGQVLEATDESLGRQVAIKQVLTPTAETLARFEREAKLTARLQHAGVVPVYDVGRWPDGRPFFVMKKVEGRSLADLISLARSFEQRLALLPRVLTVAETVAYAHSRGVIHRDLKPSNVVVSTYGETLVIDWGLAKVIGEPSDASAEDLPGTGPNPSLTEVGRVLGTPHFMPPEQAQGAVLDERADVYALGAILYNVLAGEQPYAGQPAAAVLAMVRRTRPAPLRGRAPEVSSDLAAIVNKAMSRSAAERYANASELAEDLRRYLDGQLVRARQYPPAALVARWLRRHRTGVTLAALLLGAVAVSAVVAVRRVLAERNAAVVARQAVESRENALTLLQAQRNLPDEPTAVLAWLKRHRPEPQQAWLPAAIADEAVALGVARHVFEFPVPSPAVAVSRKEGLMAAGSSDGGLVLYDLGSGRRRPLDRHPAAVTDLAFSPAGGHLVSGDTLGNVRLWSSSGRLLRRLGLGKLPVSWLVYSSDGSQLAAVLGRQTVIQLRPGDLGRGATFQMETQLNGLAYCPQTDALVALDREGRAQVLDRGARFFRLLPGRHTHARLLCLPGGQRFVTGGFDGAVRLWDVQAGARRLLGRHDDWVTSIAASPDGSLVATGSGDDTARIFPLAGGPTRVLRGHRDMVRGLVFSPTGDRLATLSFDSAVRLWDVTSGELQTEDRAPRLGATRLHLTADGTHLVASSSQEARVWPLMVPRSRALRGHTGPITSLAWSADGQVVASTSRDQTVRTWNLDRTSALDAGGGWVSPALESWTMFARFMRPRQLLVSTRLGRNQLIDLPTGRVVEVVPPGSMWSVPPTGPDRMAIAVGGRGSIVNLSTRSRVPLQNGPTPMKAMVLSLDGKKALAASEDGLMGLWSTEDGRALKRHQLAEQIFDLALSPDQRWAAVATAHNRLLLWDLATGHLQEVPTDRVRGDNLLFTRDSRTLAYKAWDGTVRLIDVGSRTSRTLHGHRSRINRLASTTSGPPLLASGDASGFVRLWNLRTQQTAVLYAQTQTVDQMAFSPDGRHLATTGGDPNIRIWDLRTVPFSHPTDRTPTWLSARTTATIDEKSDLRTP